MKIGLGADPLGLELKEVVKQQLMAQGHTCVDIGGTADKDLAVRFNHPANEAVLAFLGRACPWSAHGDLAEQLLLAAQQVPEAETYCPDMARYAYVVLHTRMRVMCALALGMTHLSLRLPDQGRAVISDGARPSQELGPEWYEFPVFAGDREETRERIGRWFRVSYDLAHRTESIR